VSIDDYPLKSSAKPGNGLKMRFVGNEKIDREARCTTMSFIVHSPHEAAASFEIEEMYQFLYGYDLEVLITPEIIQTDEDLKDIDPNERGCFFQGEKKLKYFKVYSRRNCELECISDYLGSLIAFNCSQFYMARRNEQKVCDHRFEAKIRLEASKFMRPYKKTPLNETFRGCSCLDECNSIKYKTEVIGHSCSVVKTDFYGNFHFETEIEFKFKDVDVVPLQRYRQMTFSNFLAQSGGMMGLFAGISVLSVIELLYFMTVRWMVDLCRWIKTRMT
jgi:acid-sensing ion channel, other